MHLMLIERGHTARDHESFRNGVPHLRGKKTTKFASAVRWSDRGEYPRHSQFDNVDWLRINLFMSHLNYIHTFALSLRLHLANLCARPTRINFHRLLPLNHPMPTTKYKCNVLNSFTHAANVVTGWLVYENILRKFKEESAINLNSCALNHAKWYASQTQSFQRTLYFVVSFDLVTP